MRLVYTGTDGAVYTWQRGEGAPRSITWGWDEVDANGERSRLAYTWPTCSRDGRHILALAQRSPERHFVHVIDATGVEISEIASLDGSAPIYANWSPDGRRVAVLVQCGDTLALEILGIEAPHARLRAVRGAPLFWSWSPDGTMLAVHAGQSREDLSAGGVLLVDAATGKTTEVLSAVPSLFRAPSWSAAGTTLAFVRPTDNGNRLVFVDLGSGERRSRTLDRGPVAFVWHPRLPIIAYATATDESPHVYDRVVVLDLQADRERTVAQPTLAFFWHPDEPTLFRLGLDRKREKLSWEVDANEHGDLVSLARFLPTRETVFAASFFDQYALSHAPIAPDGSAIAVAGQLAEDADAKGPRIYLLSTDGDGMAEAVGEGVYGVWGE